MHCLNEMVSDGVVFFVILPLLGDFSYPSKVFGERVMFFLEITKKSSFQMNFVWSSLGRSVVSASGKESSILIVFTCEYHTRSYLDRYLGFCLDLLFPIATFLLSSLLFRRDFRQLGIPKFTQKQRIEFNETRARMVLSQRVSDKRVVM